MKRTIKMNATQSNSDARGTAPRLFAGLYTGHYNVTRRKLTKLPMLTPEQQSRLFERAMAKQFADKPLPHLTVKRQDGKPWTLYNMARKACYGKLTEDMRAEHMDIFLLNYADMLQSAIMGILDAERVAKTVARLQKKYPTLTAQQLLLRGYFRTASNAIKNHIDANKATFYRIAVNQETGKAMTKEEAKEARQARSSYYAESKYEPETIGTYLDDEGNIVTLIDYHEPTAHYNQRVATVNQDATYKASTSFTESDNLSGDASELELKMVLLHMDLKALLADKPNDLKVAEQLLDGTMAWTDCGRMSPRRRNRIHDAFSACLNA